jgi:hypothetical protein
VVAAALILETLKQSGIRIWATGEKLVVEPASLLTPELRQGIRAQKSHLLALVGTQPPANDFAEPPEPAEGDAGLLREWTAGVAQLQTRRPPTSIAAWRWQQVINDAEHFVARWAKLALTLGWRTPDAFGVHAGKLEERFDAAGLVWCLRGASVLAINGSAAQLRTTSGVVQTFTRSEAANFEAAAIWSL